MCQDENAHTAADGTRSVAPTYHASTGTPTCGSTATWTGRPCSFPVAHADERCYVHEEDALWPTADPEGFLQRAAIDPPPTVREAVAQADADHGGLLAEYYVRYSRLLDSAELAAELARAETESFELAEMLLADGLVSEASTADGEPGEQLRPEVRRYLRARRYLRQLRTTAGLTAVSDDAAPVAVNPTMLWGERSE